MKSEPYWINFLTNSVQTGASSGLDAKPVIIEQTGGPFFCTAAPKARFQNYSKTQTITSATINVLSGSTTISTQNWTGSLAPYAVADVSMPAFNQYGPYKFEVTVTGDVVPANNAMNVSLDILSAQSAATIPSMENLDSYTFQTVASWPSRYIFTDPLRLFGHSSKMMEPDFSGLLSVTGSNGQITQAGAIFYSDGSNGTIAELMLGNFNTATASAPSFQFDWAHASNAASGPGSSDKLEILESIDCGASWQSVFSQQGSGLSTVSSFPTTFFIPRSASDWKHKGTNPLSKNTNLYLKLKATSSDGVNNVGWFDNLQMSTTLAVGDVLSESSVSLYPNPTRDEASLEFSLVKPVNVTVHVLDIKGRVVANIANDRMGAGSHKLSISTANISAGVYNVKIQTEAGSRTERLMVVK